MHVNFPSTLWNKCCPWQKAEWLLNHESLILPDSHWVTVSCSQVPQCQMSLQIVGFGILAFQTLLNSKLHHQTCASNVGGKKESTNHHISSFLFVRIKLVPGINLLPRSAYIANLKQTDSSKYTQSDPGVGSFMNLEHDQIDCNKNKLPGHSSHEFCANFRQLAWNILWWKNYSFSTLSLIHLIYPWIPLSTSLWGSLSITMPMIHSVNFPHMYVVPVSLFLWLVRDRARRFWIFS